MVALVRKCYLPSILLATTIKSFIKRNKKSENFFRRVVVVCFKFEFSAQITCKKYKWIHLPWKVWLYSTKPFEISQLKTSSTQLFSFRLTNAILKFGEYFIVEESFYNSTFTFRDDSRMMQSRTPSLRSFCPSGGFALEFGIN